MSDRAPVEKVSNGEPPLSEDVMDLVAFTVARRAMKYLAVVAVVAAIPAGYFGYDLGDKLIELDAKLQQLDDRIEGARKQVDEQLDLFKGHYESTERKTAALQVDVASAVDSAKSQEMLVYRAAGASDNARQRVLALTTDLREEIRRDTTAQRARLDDLADNLEETFNTRVDDILKRVEKQEATIRDLIQDSNKTLAKAEGQLDAASERLDQLALDMQNTGTFALREKREAELIPRFGIKARVGVISGKNRLIKRLVIHDLNDRCLAYEPNVTLQKAVTFDHARHRYRLYPNYVIEIFPGDDIAVFDIARTQAPVGSRADAPVVTCPD